MKPRLVALLLATGYSLAFKSLLPSARFGVARTKTHIAATLDGPRIAVVGTGGVGGYYGSRLWEAGYDVNFQMRGENFKVSKKNGLNVSVSNKKRTRSAVV